MSINPGQLTIEEVHRRNREVMAPYHSAVLKWETELTAANQNHAAVLAKSSEVAEILEKAMEARSKVVLQAVLGNQVATKELAAANSMLASAQQQQQDVRLAAEITAGAVRRVEEEVQRARTAVSIMGRTHPESQAGQYSASGSGK